MTRPPNTLVPRSTQSGWLPWRVARTVTPRKNIPIPRDTRGTIPTVAVRALKANKELRIKFEAIDRLMDCRTASGEIVADPKTLSSATLTY